jgi:predicted CXXCH cytochrome family protein
MDNDGKKTLTLVLITAAFAALALAFVRAPAPATGYRPPLVPPNSLAGVTPPGTVRISAAQLRQSGGDASGLECYACHDRKKPPVVKFDAGQRIIFPKEHADLIIAMRNCDECHAASKPVKLEYRDDGSVIMPAAHQNLTGMLHGRNLRNENCYNCHEQNALDRLHTAEGKELTFDQATQLCAGCHGPTYRDWEAGAHGRISGYWDRAAGPATRQQCTSCHDPHAPAFTGLIPMPAPHYLHPGDAPKSHD